MRWSIQSRFSVYPKDTVVRLDIPYYFRDNERHNLPHVHARYQGQEAVIAIEDGTVLEGHLPVRQLRMVQVWVSIKPWTGLRAWALFYKPVVYAVC